MFKNSLVSVIITTRNSAPTLEALLKSIKNQSYQQTEVIVVDNSSRDETCKIAKKYTDKVFDKGPERSAQRNFGATKARGGFLLFLDSDMVLSKDVVRECVMVMKNGNYGGLIIPEKSFGEKFWAKVKTWERKLNEGETYFEASRLFSKKVFNTIGGYDENLTGPEDWDFHQRVAKKFAIKRIKSYILHNEWETTLKTLIQKKYYYGLSAHRYLEKQSIPVLSPTTIYFLRPSFYKNWKKAISHPLLSFSMLIMLIFESFAGGLGYIVGRLKNGK